MNVVGHAGYPVKCYAMEGWWIHLHVNRGGEEESKAMGSRVHPVDKERRGICGGEGVGARFHRNSGRMGAPSNATILRLAGLDKHRWDNGRLEQLVALETRMVEGHSVDLATLPYAIAACRKIRVGIFFRSIEARGYI